MVNEETRHGYAVRGTKLGFLRGGSWRELKEGTVQRKNPRPENQGKRDIYIYIEREREREREKSAGLLIFGGRERKSDKTERQTKTERESETVSNSK